MKKQSVLVVLALCLALLGSTHPSLAQEDDSLAALQREGWKIVKDGVLQRELVPGEVESFVFGVPGFTWKLQDLGRQLQKLQAEFRAHPTPELRKAIANHRKAVASARKALAIARTAEDLGEAAPPKVSCAINFSYDATAAGKTDVRGVVANASATFSANCGFSGQVYAYAFAKATVNGAETTQTVTDGPRSGASVSATAFASRNGSTPCESYGYGEMVSYGLSPSSYSKSAQNYNCPVVATATPLSVSVTSNYGPIIDIYEYDCATITWTTNISGGTLPYASTMYKNNVSQGARTTYSASFCGSNTNTTATVTVSANVTDSSSPVQSGSGSQTTTIRYHRIITTTCPTCVEP
jgi:hypothetical protein